MLKVFSFLLLIFTAKKNIMRFKKSTRGKKQNVKLIVVKDQKTTHLAFKGFCILYCLLPRIIKK